MPKFFCDYCDVFLTHDSQSVRRAHNSGRNHLRNVVEYYEQLSYGQAQQIIDSITSSYAAEGQANPMFQQGIGGPPPPPAGGFGGMQPPFGMNGPGPNAPAFPGPGGKGMSFPPFPPNGQGPPNLPNGMPFPPPGGGFPPNFQFPQGGQGGPPGGFPPQGVAQGPPGGQSQSPVSGPQPNFQGPPPGFNMGGPPGMSGNRG